MQQALRPYPQFTGITYLNNYRGKTRYDSLQATLERHFRDDFAVLVAYTLSKTQDNVLTQDGSGDEWALAANRHFPHFLKLTWIYELPIGPGKRIDVDGVLGQIVGGWTITGIHNYRSGNTLSVSDGSHQRRAAIPSVPMSCRGADQVNYDGSAVDLVNGTPYLNPAAFATQPLSAQGIPTRIGTAPAILDVRGPALYTEDLGFLKRFGVGDRNAGVQIGHPEPVQSLRSGRPQHRPVEPELREDLRRRPGRAAVAGLAEGDLLREHGQLPTPNFQLPTDSRPERFPLGVGSW